MNFLIVVIKHLDTCHTHGSDCKAEWHKQSNSEVGTRKKNASKCVCVKGSAWEREAGDRYHWILWKFLKSKSDFSYYTKSSFTSNHQTGQIIPMIQTM